jgi:hypothetical protein
MRMRGFNHVLFADLVWEAGRSIYDSDSHNVSSLSEARPRTQCEQCRIVEIAWAGPNRQGWCDVCDDKGLNGGCHTEP